MRHHIPQTKIKDFCQPPLGKGAFIFHPVNAADIQSVEQGEDIYRLSCVVIDIDHFMERSYLDALADALGIPPARRAELEADASQGRRQLVDAGAMETV